MPSREVLDRIKSATVAFALVPDKPPLDRRQTPFTILGSGFCIDPIGIVVTCEHVISAFTHGDIRQIIAEVPEHDRKQAVWPLRNLQALVPHVLFFRMDPRGEDLIVIMVPVAVATAKLEFDLGAAALRPHSAFPRGYPFLEVEPFSSIYEGMDIATCGFPLGNEMQRQVGSMTSSFARGILSSIAPAPRTREELVKGFQLDITATHGNSGGPVFSWETGGVIGVLQGGPTLAPGQVLPGIARAEPIYRLLHDGLLDRLKASGPDFRIPAPE
jgi:S1-C subfamily serine protease